MLMYKVEPSCVWVKISKRLTIINCECNNADLILKIKLVLTVTVIRN